MGLAKKAVFFLLMMAVCGMSMGSVYKVGDSSGWTNIGHVDYNSWSATKNFHVGDTILFEYNNQFHNVIRVTHKNFNACNGTAPYATFTSGNDSFTIKRGGHFYFICDFPGHCQAGQKVDIRVPRTSQLIPTPAPAPALALALSSSPSPARSSSPSPAAHNPPNMAPSPAPHNPPNLAPSSSPSPAPHNSNMAPSSSPSPAPHNPPNMAPSPAPRSPNLAPSSSPNPAPYEPMLSPPLPSPLPSAADQPVPHNSAPYVHLSKGQLASKLWLSMVVIAFCVSGFVF